MSSKIYPAGNGLLFKKSKGRTKCDVRICFAIEWYELEEDAELANKLTRKAGNCYNGGWFHGMPCGRDRGFDHTDDEGTKWYAVTF